MKVRTILAIIAVGVLVLALLVTRGGFGRMRMLPHGFPAIGGHTATPAVGQVAKMSKESVLRVAKAIDEAGINKDTTEIFRYLAPEFTLTVKHEDGLIVMRLLREQYRSVLIDAFAKTAKSKMAHGNISIEVAPDGNTAVARYETLQYEDLLQKGQLVSANAEVDTYTLREGKILLSHAEITLADVVPRGTK